MDQCSPEALAFLKQVIASRSNLIEIPKTMSYGLAREIERAGGPLVWAMTRREYAALRANLSKSRATGNSRVQPAAKAQQEQRIRQIRANFVNAVLATARTGKPLPPTPKALRAEIERAGKGVLAWAKAQPEADEVIQKLATGSVGVRREPQVVVRHSYLGSVVAAIMRGGAMPRVPKHGGDWLEAEIAAAGDVCAWARQQRDYEALARRALDRMKRKNGVTS
ncbi:MAG TPA: hypothetical protein VIL84_06380 [Devosiaceae bacterium]